MIAPYHRIWCAANGPGPWLCFGCGHEVTGLGALSEASWREQGVIHHHDGNHGNNALGNLRVMHHGCHARHHNTRSTKSIHARMDAASPKHNYQQLAEHIHALIRSGELQPGEGLPPLNRTARNSNVAVGTVSRAYDVLKDEGLVYSVRGRGMFVTRQEDGP